MGLTDKKDDDSNSQEQMRDTLGFLKKSEVEKKKREEQKAAQKQASLSKYKSINDVEQTLSGYDSKTVFPYQSQSVDPSLRS